MILEIRTSLKMFGQRGTNKKEKFMQQTKDKKIGLDKTKNEKFRN